MVTNDLDSGNFVLILILFYLNFRVSDRVDDRNGDSCLLVIFLSETAKNFLCNENLNKDTFNFLFLIYFVRVIKTNFVLMF